MTAADPPARRRLTTRGWVALGLAAFLALVVVLQVLGGDDGFGTVTERSGAWGYLSVFLLVTLDGICAVFPGETTLNAASTLAAQGEMNLPEVMVAGALGAIGGDSSLYWIVRSRRHKYKPRLDKWMLNPRVANAFDFVGTSAPTLLVVGRYLPCMRWVVNAMFGIQAYPYRRFLLWSAIGGTLWSIYTCGLAYLIGTALLNFPLASVVISSLVTGIALTVVYFLVRRRRRTERDAATEEPAGGVLSAEESSRQP